MSTNTQRENAVPVGETDVDAVVVGAGFAGLYMLHSLREQGLTVQGFERGEDVGGTWYWNSYPGARCDSESWVYCYSFSDELLEEWEWDERYAEQEDILSYIQFAADRLDLRRDIKFETTVESATFDESEEVWTVRTDTGNTVRTQYFISAVGCLSEPFVPDFDGLEDFGGDWYHTGQWPDDGVDFENDRVGVIGTGSSGMQIIPKVAESATHLDVFQRTPNYATPAQNRSLEPEEFEEIQENYDNIWEVSKSTGSGMPYPPAHETAEDLTMDEVREILEPRWEKGGPQFGSAFGDMVANEGTNEKVSQFIREKIHEQIDDPETADKLAPTDYPFGAKRPPRSYYDYWQTYNEDHVRLVDVDNAPIERLTTRGIQTTDAHYELDKIVFATGFDAFTGAILNMDICGRDGITLEEKWADGPRTYLGLTVHNFPNMFIITGPQSPSVLTNMPVAIEQHVEWIDECIRDMRERGKSTIEPTQEAVDEWVAHTSDIAEETLYTEASSWYRGENVPGKPSVMLPYVGGLDSYRQKCAEVIEDDYEGFKFPIEA